MAGSAISQVQTPDPAFNTMLNTWNAYNCFITFVWSRAASLIYCGLRNGYGYRDTVQDIQGIIHLEPEMACEKIRFMLSAQVDNGGGLPLVKFTHNPGHEDTPDDASYVKETGHPAYRADDALWLFPTVYKYVAETGNTAFLDEVIPFANRSEGTVYEHLKRAVQFSLDHLGPHGLPAGLYADWNDCLRLGANGESTFVAPAVLLRHADPASVCGPSRGRSGRPVAGREAGRIREQDPGPLLGTRTALSAATPETGERIGAGRRPRSKLLAQPPELGRHQRPCHRRPA